MRHPIEDHGLKAKETSPSDASSATDPTVRRPVAVIVSRFPKITETFILREIQELERQGQPVRLVPLLRHDEPVVHPEAEPWIERALYTPFLSWSIGWENVRAFLESPGHYLRTLGRALLGSIRSPNLLWGTLGIFPKSVYAGRVLAREGVGHLHAHFATHPAMAAYIASEFSGLPWSFTAHAHDIFLASSRPMLGEKIRRAAFVRVISKYNQRFLEERYPDAARGHIRVIHMGIDPDGYGPGETDPKRIVCVASLRPYKGIPALVEACSRPPLRDRDFQLSIVGDGPDRPEIEKKIHDLGLNDRVALLGSRTQEEVAALLGSASIFVHPSTVTRQGWMDGIPVALMEAMATRLPVVSTWVSGIPELVEDGKSGILVFPDDPGALAEALASLLDDPARARAMGVSARRKIQEAFDLEQCAPLLVETLELHTLPTPERINRAVGPGLEVAAGGPSGSEAMPAAPTVGIRRVHERTDSLVAELMTRIRDESEELVVKVHQPVAGAPRSPAERARTEYELLHHLHVSSVVQAEEFAETRRSPHPGRRWGRVPRPLAVVEPEGALVMERARGTPLDALLREWRGGRWGGDDTPLSALRATGGWLRWFQDQAPGQTATSPAEAFERLLTEAARDLERSRRRLSSSVAARVGSRLFHFETEGVPAALTTVGHHCDFWPGNVLVEGTRISVIDFEGYRLGLPEEDVAYFIVHLELLLSKPWHRDKLDQARRAFLEGYGVIEDATPGLLDLCYLAKGLQLLARSAQSDGVDPVRWWRRRVAENIVSKSLPGTTDRAPEGVAL
jgi:colanic acid/amylovoran biosynthesis glycosyltransferase